jgi:hypothetical protein
MPFEGACDNRIRLADMVINESVMLAIMASLRAQINVKGVEASDVGRAANIQILLKWVLRNQIGLDYIRELLKLGNYVYGDSPGLGFMSVYWRRETALELREMTAQEMMLLYIDFAMEQFQPTEEELSEEEYRDAATDAATSFIEALADPETGNEGLAQMLLQLFPYLKPARARSVIRQLREGEIATFPAPYVRYDGPEFAAKRLYDDWFIASNTMEFQKARAYFDAQWIDKVEARERALVEGWSDEFLEKLLGKDDRDNGQQGVAVFKEYARTASGQLRETDQSDYENLYQVLTGYFRSTNADGIPGRYFVTFHPNIDVAATDKQLLDYDHGKYPGHVVQREVLTKRMFDCRGLAELAATNQDMIKLFIDSFGDNAQLSGVPPIVTRGRRSQGRLYIEPLGELQAKRDGDYKWMDPPQYPQTIDKMLNELRRQFDEYHGRANEEVSTELVTLHNEFKVMWWLANLREILTQLLQLCQQFMSDETVQRVTNAEGVSVLRTREDIQGQFDLEITFDPRDFDPEFLAAMGRIVRETLMAIDTDKTIQTAPIVENLMYRMFPDLAERSLRPVEQANLDELQDEFNKYQEILAGREPERGAPGSENYELRLNMYRQLEAANPIIYNDLPPDRQAILFARLEYLQAQAEQFGTNAQIGREGAPRALEEGGA